MGVGSVPATTLVIKTRENECSLLRDRAAVMTGEETRHYGVIQCKPIRYIKSNKLIFDGLIFRSGTIWRRKVPPSCRNLPRGCYELCR